MMRPIKTGLIMVAGPVILLAAVGAMGLASRAAAPKKTKCLDSINEWGAAVKQEKELAGHIEDKKREIVMKQHFVPDFEKDPDAKEVKEMMERRAELNRAVDKKWEAWKSCSEGMQK
ncbi:MAG: hypothetical protein GY852_03070 [bacterium]|nr:hypothetical protein [bacterium]